MSRKKVKKALSNDPSHNFGDIHLKKVFEELGVRKDVLVAKKILTREKFIGTDINRVLALNTKPTLKSPIYFITI
jgi:hypothetical protein